MTVRAGWIRAYALDAALAAGFAVLVVVESSTQVDDGYRNGAVGWNLPLLLGTVACLPWRRRFPLTALLAGYAFVVVPSLFIAHTIYFFGTLLPLLLLTYTAARVGRHPFVPALVAAVVLLVVPIHQRDFDAGDYLFWATMAGIALALGTVMHRLDRHRAALAATLAEQVHDQALREHALLLDERTRIARELHDVVAHAVSLMVVQAGAARLAVGLDDTEARAGLLAVEHAGRAALVDLRRLVGVLRPDADDADISPAPGLGVLDELVERMRAAGLRVEVTRTGEPWPLPAGLDLSLYRIVQESLTNALKHAGPTAVAVRFTYGDELTVEVVDEGPVRRPRRDAGPTGHGLVGMRERAAAFGGTFTAGASGAGWRVAVRIPRTAGVPREPSGAPS
jgi:signal transduction histidine kinase